VIYAAYVEREKAGYLSLLLYRTSYTEEAAYDGFSSSAYLYIVCPVVLFVMSWDYVLGKLTWPGISNAM